MIYNFFTELIDLDNDNRLWIFKPSASSCGKGIKILSKESPIPESKKGFIISEYISNPHLIEGLKYDLRVYVLVTSYDPLVIYMYNDGLARFATEKFNLDEEDFENRFIHLTNYSIQKKSEVYQQNKNKQSSNLKASKWSLKTLQKVFEDHGKDYQAVKERMKDLIIKTIISVDEPINSAMKEGTDLSDIWFEIYGFDILIDSNLKPWILEVNISPSLSSSSPFDKNVKTMLVWDALTIVGLKPANHKKYTQKEDSKDSSSAVEKEKLVINIEDGNLDEEDIDKILDFEEEKSRCQNFEIIFPIEKTYKKYVKFFETKRYKNHLLWSHIKKPLIDVDSYLA